MFHTSTTNECSFCQQASWPMYTVRAIYGDYQPQRHHSTTASTGTFSNALSDLLMVCSSCLYSRDDLIEWYENDPLCQQMDGLDIGN